MIKTDSQLAREVLEELRRDAVLMKNAVEQARRGGAKLGITPTRHKYRTKVSLLARLGLAKKRVQIQFCDDPKKRWADFVPTVFRLLQAAEFTEVEDAEQRLRMAASYVNPREWQS